MPMTEPPGAPSRNSDNCDRPAPPAARDELYGSDRPLRGILDAMREGFAHFDDNFTILEVNEETLRLDGRSREELIGRSHWEAFPRSEHSPVGELYKRVMAVREPGSLEHVYQWPDGRQMWIDVRAYPTADGGVACFWRDITERKDTEQRLRESESKYRTLFETMGQGYCELELVRDEQGRAVDQLYLELNPAFERLFGIRVADAIGRRAGELFPGLERAWTETLDRVARTGRPERIEGEIEQLGRWFEVSAYPGKGDRVIALYDDISERKRAELERQRLEERQAFLLRLSDVLRPIGDAGEIQATTTRLLAEHLGVDRAMYAEVEGEHGSEVGTIRGQYVRPPATPFAERFAYGRFGSHTMEARYRGEPLVVRDIESDQGFRAEERAAWIKAGVRAAIITTLAKDGRLVAELGLQSATPRAWTGTEIELVQDVAERTWDAVQRARAEAALRESEERFQLLVRFTDAVRDVTDPAVVADTACRMITQKLKTDLTLWAVIDEAAGEYVTERVFYADGKELAPTRWPLNPDDPFAAEHLRGAAVAYSDAAADAYIPGTTRRAMVERGNAAGIAAPVLVAGRLRAVMNTSQRVAPRDWTREEVALVQALAERAWAEIERARAVTALRESEEKYRNLFESMDEAYAVVEVLKDEQGRWADFRFLDANPAFIQHTSMPCPVGKTATELLGSPNPRWTELYGRALDTGEALRVEEREQTLGRIFDLNIFSLDRERNRVAVLFTNVTERRRAEEHQKTLLAELQHRVRNIMAMIRSVARRTSESAETVEDYVQHLEGRISAMARTQALLTREVQAEVDLQSLILDELQMQAAQPGHYVVAGPDVSLPAKAAEVLGLAIHELATNSVKYGALSERDGRIDVRWALLNGDDRVQLSLIWSEFGVTIRGQPDRRGFGTELITQRVPYELEGTGTMEFRPTGLVVTIEFPLAERASILQTNARNRGSA